MKYHPLFNFNASRIILILTLILCNFISLSAQDVGVIRWDAWVGDLHMAGYETEESMGPPEYHWKAPFYSNILDDFYCDRNIQ